MNVRSSIAREHSIAPVRGNETVRVWNPIVRLFHWTVVLGCAINLMLEDGGKVHRSVGYIVAAAVAVRLVWGFTGKGPARFNSFISHPAAL